MLQLHPRHFGLGFVAIACFVAGRLIASHSPINLKPSAKESRAFSTEKTLTPSAKNFSTLAERQQRWLVYDLVHHPSFQLSAGGDGSALKELLEKDFNKTVDALAKIDIVHSTVGIEIPLYLATHLAAQPFHEAATQLQRISHNEALHRRTLEQLVVQIDDAKDRKAELLDFLRKQPHSLEAKHSAEMIGLRLSDDGDDEAFLHFALSLPKGNGSSRAALLTGAIQSWSEDPGKAEAFVEKLDSNSGEFDRVLAHHAGASAKADALHGIHWAQKIRDPEIQSNAAADALSRWGESDPSALKAWIQENENSSNLAIKRAISITKEHFSKP